MILILSCGVLIFLTIRLFYDHVDGVKSERQWYIEQLDFEFSGVIDTVNRPGHILFHVTNGNIDREKEDIVNEKLKRNGFLDLFLYKSNDQIELMIDGAHKYMNGDSIYLNSSKNLVKIYRNKKLLSEYELLRSIRGRPF